WTKAEELYFVLCRLLNCLLEVLQFDTEAQLKGLLHHRLNHVVGIKWVGEREHFLRNYVCVAADGASKQLGLLENRRTDFAVAEGGEDFVGGLLDAIPERGFGRQEIACATDRLESAALFLFCCGVAHETGSSL